MRSESIRAQGGKRRPGSNTACLYDSRFVVRTVIRICAEDGYSAVISVFPL